VSVGEGDGDDVATTVGEGVGVGDGVDAVDPQAASVADSRTRPMSRMERFFTRSPLPSAKTSEWCG
jgi:hypothetical protein